MVVKGLQFAPFLRVSASTSALLASNSKDTDVQRYKRQSAEIWKILKEITINQRKTDRTLQEITINRKKTYLMLQEIAINQKKTDQMLRDLIGYNSDEMEVICADLWCQFLSKDNWNTTLVDVKDIYSPDGKKITDCDGIIFAINPKYDFSVLFFIEVKEIFTLEEYNLFKERLEVLRELVPTLDPNRKPKPDKSYKEDVARKISRYTRLQDYQECKIIGVVASPYMDESAMNAVITDKVSFLKLVNEQFEVAELHL